MRVCRRIISHKPWITEHIRILQHQLKGSELGVFPECLGDSKRRFMDRSVLAVGRPAVTIAYQLSIGVHRRIRPDEGAAVIRIAWRFLDLHPKSIHGGPGMNRRQAAIRTANQIGCEAKDPASAAVAPVVVADNSETFGELKVDVDGTAEAVAGVM